MAGMGLSLAAAGGSAAQSLEDIIAQRQALNEFNRQLRLDEERKLIAEREADQRQQALGLQEREIGANEAWRRSQTEFQNRQLTEQGTIHREDLASRERIAQADQELQRARNRWEEISARAQAAATGAQAAAIAEHRRQVQDALKLADQVQDPDARIALKTRILTGANVGFGDVNPKQDYEYRKDLKDPYGLGDVLGGGGTPAPGQTSRIPEGKTATGPNGERAVYRNGQWVFEGAPATPAPPRQAPPPALQPFAPMMPSHSRPQVGSMPVPVMPRGENYAIPKEIQRGALIAALQGQR